MGHFEDVGHTPQSKHTGGAVKGAVLPPQVVHFEAWKVIFRWCTLSDRRQSASPSRQPAQPLPGRGASEPPAARPHPADGSTAHDGAGHFTPAKPTQPVSLSMPEKNRSGPVLWANRGPLLTRQLPFRAKRSAMHFSNKKRARGFPPARLPAGRRPSIGDPTASVTKIAS